MDAMLSPVCVLSAYVSCSQSNQTGKDAHKYTKIEKRAIQRYVYSGRGESRVKQFHVDVKKFVINMV